MGIQAQKLFYLFHVQFSIPYHCLTLWLLTFWLLSFHCNCIYIYLCIFFFFLNIYILSRVFLWPQSFLYIKLLYLIAPKGVAHKNYTRISPKDGGHKVVLYKLDWEVFFFIIHKATFQFCKYWLQCVKSYFRLKFLWELGHPVKINLTLLVDKIWMKDISFYFIYLFYFYFSVSPPRDCHLIVVRGSCVPQWP